MLSENCLLLKTDNVCGQVSVHIFMQNGGYCLYIHQNQIKCWPVTKVADNPRYQSELPANTYSSWEAQENVSKQTW